METLSGSIITGSVMRNSEFLNFQFEKLMRPAGPVLKQLF